MSSICTADPAGPWPSPAASRKPPGAALAAVRSASLSAAHTHSTSACPATDDRPDTIPPPPRRLVSFPSSLSRNETGPRLEATSTRPRALAFMPVRLARSGVGSRWPDRLECWGQLHNAHPEGWRERPCEAPATTVTSGLLAGLRPAQSGASSRQVLTPARGPKAAGRDEGERPRPVSTPATKNPSRFGFASHLSCRECGATSDLGATHVCAECFGPMEVSYDLPALTTAEIEAGPPNIWRYASLLPVPPDVATGPSTEPGYTRLVRASHLARELGMGTLWVKDERANPTHSFKDRVVAVALAAAVEMGYKVLACPSTGNLANAVAAAAARAGIRSVVLIPADLERQKIAATSIYGGTMVAVDGTYDDVNRLASELADEREDWAFVNVNVRPYYAEGSKTIGFEIAEQLGWRLPAQVVVPVASGAQLVKIDKAFRELISLGLVEDTQYRVFGAQASGCAPVAAAFRAGHDVVQPVRPSTVAKSLAIGNPADGPYVLDVVRRTGGCVADVGDPEVVSAMRLLAATEGIFGETAAGVTLGVLRRLLADGLLDPAAETVIINSGDGLKTLDAVADGASAPAAGTPAAPIRPTLAAFRAFEDSVER